MPSTLLAPAPDAPAPDATAHPSARSPLPLLDDAFPLRADAPDAVAPRAAALTDTIPTTAAAGARGSDREPRLWRPDRVVVTPDALAEPWGRAMVARAEALGLDVERPRANRVTGLRRADPRAEVRDAKRTLAIVNAPPGRLRLDPIPPSADFRLDLAEGCPAHCHYCYLACSLPGPPVVRTFANLGAILDAATAHVRPDAETSFESSCYTDPLALEHLTGSLAATIAWFGDARRAPAGARLRWTSKFTTPALVAPLLDLPHAGRTRVRASVNAEPVARRFEAGTAPVTRRLAGLAQLAEAGYPVGLTIAPITPVPDWETHYAALLDAAASALPPAADLTVELITHRFTPGSKRVLCGWYPNSALEMDEAARAEKRHKHGGVKYVLRAESMRAVRAWFTRAIAERLPGGRVLYWT